MGSDLLRDLDAVRDAAWQHYRGRVGDDSWVALRLGQLLDAAAGTAVCKLFPYTSHNTLNFSRCSSYPFTHDCPWILFTPEGRFISYLPDPGGAQGNVAKVVPPVLVETEDPAVAVAAVIAALPATWQQVWVGNVESRFRFRVDHVHPDLHGYEGILVAGPVLECGPPFAVGDSVSIPTAGGPADARCTGFPLIRWGQERRAWVSITVTGVATAAVQLGGIVQA